jgi:hypothetical protein
MSKVDKLLSLVEYKEDKIVDTIHYNGYTIQIISTYGNNLHKPKFKAVIKEWEGEPYLTNNPMFYNAREAVKYGKDLIKSENLIKLIEYAGEKINTEYKGFKITGEEPHDGPDGFFIMSITTPDGGVLYKNFNAPEDFINNFQGDKSSAGPSIAYAKSLIDRFIQEREAHLNDLEKFRRMMRKEEHKNIGENKMSRAGKFLSNLTKLPERYQLILEDLSKSSYKDLIPQDLAIVLTKMTACAAIGNDVTLYVKSGTGKDAAEGKNGKTTEQRTANDWTVAVYGGNVETSQPVVAVYNTKNKSSFTFSTSKENLKKLGESKVEKKKAKNEAFFNKTGEVNFETLANLKKELSGFGLKDGSDFRANLFGTNLELYLSMAADALPEQINDLINRYGFNKGEGSVEFKKELEIEPKKDEAPMEAKKKVVKKKILKKAPLASGKKSKGIKKF